MSAVNPGSGLENQNSLCTLRTIPYCLNKGALTELAPSTHFSKGQLLKAKGTEKSNCSHRNSLLLATTYLWSTTWSHDHTEVWICMAASMYKTLQVTWLRNPKFLRNWKFLNTPALKVDP